MFIYLWTFSISALLFYLAEKVKIFNNLFAICALILPALLAGFRSLYIGTDVMNYVYPLFSIARNSSSYFEYLRMPAINGGIMQTVSSYEYGYTFITYLVAKVTNSFQILQIVIELFILCFIYFGIKRLKRYNSSIWLIMLTFYLIFFNNTLNMVRQWMAMSIILFGFKYIKNQEFLKFLVIVIFAFFFHSTAIIGLIFYFIYYFVDNDSFKYLTFNSNSNNYVPMRAIKFIFIVVISLLFILLINKLYPLLSKIGLSKYNYYLSGKLTFSITQFLIKLPIFIIISFNINEILKSKSKIYFYLMVVLDILVSQLAGLSDYSIRISTYVSMFNIYGYAILSSSNNKVKLVCIRIAIIIYLIIYWYYIYSVRGNDQTIPYIFFN